MPATTAARSSASESLLRSWQLLSKKILIKYTVLKSELTCALPNSQHTPNAHGYDLCSLAKSSQSQSLLCSLPDTPPSPCTPRPGITHSSSVGLNTGAWEGCTPFRVLLLTMFSLIPVLVAIVCILIVWIFKNVARSIKRRKEEPRVQAKPRPCVHENLKDNTGLYQVEEGKDTGNAVWFPAFAFLWCMKADGRAYGEEETDAGQFPHRRPPYKQMSM